MIKIEELTKTYGGVGGIKDVSFTCEPGTVTGFLGPNGAGKSTTLKAICGMVNVDSGVATVLGSPYRELSNPGSRVGVLLDASAQHVGRRGAETLALTAATIGVDHGRAEVLREFVGLEKKAGRKRVGDYSLGMRQRLGLANALIGDPEVLILDEPANGLDPDGIRWMRELLLDFAARGGTVLLSSHLLREVDAVADQLVIIANGQIVAAGERDELVGRAGTTAQATDLVALETAMALAELSARRIGNDRLIVDAEPAVVARAAIDQGVIVTHLEEGGDQALEALFFELTDASQ
jgi:ABC-2 type transport system ATP-binding protein